MAAVVADAMQSPSAEAGDDYQGRDQIPAIKHGHPTMAPTYSAELTANPANPRATDGCMYPWDRRRHLLARDRLALLEEFEKPWIRVGGAADLRHALRCLSRLEAHSRVR